MLFNRSRLVELRRPRRCLSETPVRMSLLQWYFVRAWPYYFIVVVSPLVCAFATWLGRDRAFAFLLFIHASILMVVVTALSPQACIRYLKPVSVLTLLSIAICVDWLARRASPATMQSAP